MDFTKPFEVGKHYRRVDGTMVTCIKTSDTHKGYESAQFDDHDELWERVTRDAIEGKTTKEIMLLLSYGGVGKPTDSGHRYNRENDRGRCTGSKWDQFAVIPEPDTADYKLDLLEHVLLAHKVRRDES